VHHSIAASAVVRGAPNKRMEACTGRATMSSTAAGLPPRSTHVRATTRFVYRGLHERTSPQRSNPRSCAWPVQTF